MATTPDAATSVIALEEGSRVVFAGDSVTDCGRRMGHHAPALGYGYVYALSERLKGTDRNIEVVNAGVGGNTSRDLLGRLGPDVHELKPDIVSVMIGVNDTWRRYDSATLTSEAEFEQNYRGIVESLLEHTEARQVVAMEPFILPVNDAQQTWFEDLDLKQAVIARLAGEYGLVRIETQRLMAQAAVELAPFSLALDGVHPTELGHTVLASLWWDHTDLV